MKYFLFIFLYIFLNIFGTLSYEEVNINAINWKANQLERGLLMAHK